MTFAGTPMQIVGSSTARTLLAIPSAAYTTTSGSLLFDTSTVSTLAMDITVTSFTGGTSPSITLNLDRQGADGVWYNMWPGNATGQVISSAGAFSVDVSPGGGSWSPPNGSQHAVLGAQARFRWAFTGTAAPTAVTYSVSIIGR